MLLGDYTPASFGVLTHQLGLVGCLSGQLRNITGRGIEMEACANVSMTLHDLVGRVQNLPPVRSGAVMVVVGLNDALRLTSPRKWKRDLRALSEAIRRDPIEDVQILIIEIPPIDMLWTLNSLSRRVAARHARLLNETTRNFCRHLTSTTFLPFHPAADDGEPAVHAWGHEMYQEWSHELAVPLAGALHRARMDHETADN